MSVKYNCYIDESGDEGFGESSPPWFFLTGVIVQDENDALVRASIDHFKKTIWTDKNKKAPEHFHWVKLKHSERLFVSKYLATLPITVVSIGMWKRKLDRVRILNNSDSLFMYACRFLLERVSWLVDDCGGVAKIIFSNRTRFKLDMLQAYVEQILKTNCEIRPIFKAQEIKVMNTNQLRMLQVADSCASATGNAFNHDDFGNINPYYLQNLSPRLYRRKGRLLSYGLKLFPSNGEITSQYSFLTDLFKS